jgi:hypothetical protein
MYIICHVLLLIGAMRCLAQILMRFPPDLTTHNLHELHWALERAQVIRFYCVRFKFTRFHFIKFHFMKIFFVNSFYSNIAQLQPPVTDGIFALVNLKI